MTLVESHGDPLALRGLIARASATAPATSICAGALRQRVVALTRVVVHGNRGVLAGSPSPCSASARELAWSTSATTPLATPAAMLVPDSRM